MSDDGETRGRRSKHASVVRGPSPGLAARIKLLEADADKRAAYNAHVAYGRLSPSPSPHRSLSRTTDSLSLRSEFSGASSSIEIPTSISTSLDTGDASAMQLGKDLPPTPVDDDERRPQSGASVRSDESYAQDDDTNALTTTTPDTSVETAGNAPQAQPHPAGPYMASGLQRRSSVFSLSRISFAAQLSRLTSLSVPLSEELSERISQLSTARGMCDALTGAGQQIGRWIDTATKVLKGLDAEDDVEWAAQGKESLQEVDVAVDRFSNLMNVYVEFIDELQRRPDCGDADQDMLVEILEAMEPTLLGWSRVRELLKGVKLQVETALEWNELWTTVLQEIQVELEACQTLVFEMEEKRHINMMEDHADSVDIDTLETIMEDTPGPSFPVVSLQNGKSATETEAENRALMGLFARMQPLRASLDFLPMRIQSFQFRAEGIFPSACDDLESRRKTLERKWGKLNADAEGLKRELGEDRWVVIFRNAGKQATAMIDSVERSMNKLKEAIVVWEESGWRTDADIGKKLENYEAKKMHYGTAIERTFGIIGKGISDRFTVNGEIIRLDIHMRTRWHKIEGSIIELDQTLRDLQFDAQTLRDSISSLNSLDIGSTGLNTPGSSPASSIIVTSPSSASGVERKFTPPAGGRRPGSAASTPRPSPNSHHSRQSGIPQRSPYARLSSTGSVSSVPRGGSVSPIPNGVYMTPQMPRNTTPTSSSSSSRKSSIPSSLSNRPRWNTSTKTDGLFGHNFKPLNLTLPSPYRKTTPPSTASSRRGSSSSASGSRIPAPSPLSQAATPSPTSPRSSFARYSSGMHHLSPVRPVLRTQKSMNNLAAKNISQRPNSRMGTAPRPASRLTRPESTRPESRTATTNGRSESRTADSRPTVQVRAASALAGGRRTSMLPLPRSTTPNSKRQSLPPLAKDDRPRWR